MPELEQMSTAELLALHADIADRLAAKGITRSANNPVGDYAEYLFATAFGWKLATNSNSGFDALDSDGRRIQIKARRIRGPKIIAQLGALRNLRDSGFDILAAVIFDSRFAILRAVLLPHDVIQEQCKYSEHVRAWILTLRDDHWLLPGAIDVTAKLRFAQARLD